MDQATLGWHVMKSFLLTALLVICLLALAAVVAGQVGMLRGQRPGDIGLRNGMLKQPKAGALNAVSSQSTDPGTYIPPIVIQDAPEAAFARLQAVISRMPGNSIVVSHDRYLHVEAQTRLLRFVDDMEFVLDPEQRLIHVRSASRLGRRDFGVNRARLERIRHEFEFETRANAIPRGRRDNTQ